MFASPIVRDGAVVGVLIGRTDASLLGELTAGLGFGENGWAFLFGADGTLYAHPDKDAVIKP